MSRIAHECRVGSLSVKKGPGSAKKPNEDMDPLKDLHSPQRSESTKKDLDLLKKVWTGSLEPLKKILILQKMSVSAKKDLIYNYSKKI